MNQTSRLPRQDLVLIFVTKPEAEVREERQTGCEQLPGQARVAMATWNQ